MQNNEFGNIKKTENDKAVTEIQNFEETKVVSDNAPALETVEANEGTVTKVKRSKTDSSMMLKVSSLVVGSVAAVGVIAPTVTNASITVGVQFGEMVITDTTIAYNIIVDNPDDLELYLSLSNDFFNRVVLLDETNMSSTFEDLKENVTYELKVYTSQTFGEKTIASTSVTTLSEKDYRIARFDGATTECRCNEDGYFYFTMNYVDNIEAYSNFEAYLIDDEGNRSDCEFNSDLKSEQKIIVDGTPIKVKNDATFVIKYDAKSSDGTIQRLEYSSKVAI